MQARRGLSFGDERGNRYAIIGTVKVIDNIIAMARGPKPESSTTSTSSTGTPTTPAISTERDSILAEIDKLLAPRRDEGGLVRQAPPPVPVETFANVARTAPTPLASSDEVALLLKLDEQFDRCWTLANSLTPSAAKTAFMAQQSEAAARARVGEGREAQDAWSLSDYEEDFKARTRSAKQGANDAALEAAPIIASIAERFIAHAKSAIGDLLVGDYLNFQKFGVEFKPSLLVQTLHAALESLPKHLPREGKPVRPGSAIALFGLES